MEQKIFKYLNGNLSLLLLYKCLVTSPPTDVLTLSIRNTDKCINSYQ